MAQEGETRVCAASVTLATIPGDKQAHVPALSLRSVPLVTNS